MATRARLARNIDGYPFPGRASPEELQAIARAVRRAGRDDLGLGMEAVEIARLADPVRASLVAAQRISPDLAAAAQGWALLDADGALSVFVNEEDHLRIQAFAAGNDPRAALERADAAERALGRSLRFARDPRWGVLTASLSNVGTGLRLSALAHLPALRFLGTIGPTLEAAATLDTAIRGLHGEGTRASGDLYQVSNAVSFGRSAQQLAGRVQGVAAHLVAQERMAREKVAAHAADRLRAARDAVQAQAASAEELAEEEALRLLSLLRLAAAVGIGAGPSPAEFGRLLVQLRTGAAAEGPRDRIARAALVRAAARGTEPA